MTNKLPVVGKRYKYKFQCYEPIYILSWVGNHLCGLSNGHPMQEMQCNTREFWNFFEELPEDKVETKTETLSHISELSPEVKEAMERLWKETKAVSFLVKDDEALKRLWGAGIVLLDALDKQFKVNETSEFVDVKEEEVNNKIEAEEVVDNKIEPNKNGSFKHLDNAEEISQDIMKERVRRLENGKKD